MNSNSIISFVDLLQNVTADITTLNLSGNDPNSMVYIDAGNNLADYVATNGQLLIGSTGQPPAINTLTGSANIIITGGAGTISMDTVQQIQETSNVTFNNIICNDLTAGQIIDSGLTASELVHTNASKELISGAASLTADVSGILPIANGGTNSSTALNNGDIMISSGGKIIEGTSSTSPSFTGTVTAGQIIDSGLTASELVHTNASKELISGAASLTADVSGILPIANGGTNSSTALNNGDIMISSGGAIIEGTSATSPVFSGTVTAQNAIVTSLNNDMIVMSNGSNELTSLQIGNTFNGLGLDIIGGDLIVTSLNTNLGPTGSPSFAGLTLTGVTANSLVYNNPSQELNALALAVGESNGISLSLLSGVLTASATQNLSATGSPTFIGETLTGLTASELVLTNASKALVSGTASLTANVSGVLPIANGGTDSSTALLNGAIMISSGGKIIEGTSSTSPSFTGTITAGQIIDSGLTASELVHTNGSKQLVSGAASLTADVSGVLPIANGGTNSSIALSNGKIIVSSAGGIVEGTSVISPNFTGTVTLSNGPVLSSLTTGPLSLNSTKTMVNNNITSASTGMTISTNATTGSTVIDTPQNLQKTASPSFNGMTMNASLYSFSGYQSTTTVTGSGFSSAMNDGLLYWQPNYAVWITYVNATTLTAGVSQTVGSSGSLQKGCIVYGAGTGTSAYALTPNGQIYLKPDATGGDTTTVMYLDGGNSGGGGSILSIDGSTYNVTGNYPSFRLAFRDNGDYACDYLFQSKTQSSITNALQTNFTIFGSGEVETINNILDDGAGNFSAAGQVTSTNTYGWSLPTADITEYIFQGQLTASQILSLNTSPVTVRAAVAGKGWLVQWFIAELVWNSTAFSGAGLIYPYVGALTVTSGMTNQAIVASINNVTFQMGAYNNVSGTNTLINQPITLKATTNFSNGNSVINWSIKALLVSFA